MAGRRPLIFLFSAPSGTGKGTLVEMLLDELGDLRKLVTVTTRPKRKGEVDGESYYFVTKDEFLKLKGEGRFVETNEIFGNFYGSLRDKVDEALKAAERDGYDLVLELDVDGKRNFERYYKVISIFPKPPSSEELKRRIEMRGSEGADEIERRLRRAEREIGYAAGYDYVVVNDDLERASGELGDIVRKERAKARI